MVPSVETLWAALAFEAGVTVGVKILAEGFKELVGLKLWAFKLAASSVLCGLNS